MVVNLTNDAWYGRSAGPYQHFAIARGRAVEEGLPLVRVAYNGISGSVDAYGRVRQTIGLDNRGYLDIRLPVALPPTVYGRFGDIGFAIMLLICAVILTVMAGPGERSRSGGSA